MAKAFEPFLKTMRELDEEDVSSPNAPAPSGSSAINDTSVVLAALTRTGATKLGELQALTGLGFAQFSDAVRSLLAAGVIVLEGPSGDEIARLAPSVAAVAEG
jgi:hypothetical protein